MAMILISLGLPGINELSGSFVADAGNVGYEAGTVLETVGNAFVVGNNAWK